MIERVDKVIISNEEYRELVEKADRIETLARLYQSTEIVTNREVKTILGIETKKGDTENGTI